MIDFPNSNKHAMFDENSIKCITETESDCYSHRGSDTFIENELGQKNFPGKIKLKW
jgi:hypothetical protein